MEGAVHPFGPNAPVKDAAANRIEARRRFSHKGVAAIDGVIRRVLGGCAHVGIVDPDDARFEIPFRDAAASRAYRV